jgi:TRAP-type mannitol/chloroaromatic compound transport system substrate-binding protein
MKIENISSIDTEEVDFSFLRDDVWWLRVLFLNDLFDTLNEVILSLQEAEENFITIMNKLKAFQEKMTLWNSNDTKYFQKLDTQISLCSE